MADLSVVVLTYNERIHIERCIRSAQQFARAVFVVDSGSDDGTVEMARALGAHVVHHAWEYHARQLNWALENLPIQTEWVFRMDADEWVTEELVAELEDRLPKLPEHVTGIVLRRRLYAHGRWLRWGGQDNIRLLRIWRHGRARCEERWMDEHMMLSKGTAVEFEHDFADENEKPIDWWTIKHANYAVREAADTVLARAAQGKPEERMPEDKSSRRKRWLKVNVYSKVPLFVRPALYFGYRYFGRLGVLDGLPGLRWHLLQGFWYRFLVDSILFDVARRARVEGVDEVTAMERAYAIKLR